MKKPKFRQFYENYYNNKCYRDLRYIKDPQLMVNTEENFKVKNGYAETFKITMGTDLNNKLKNDKKFFNFIMHHRRKGAGALVSEVSYYNSFLDWNTHNKDIKYVDRLFIDLDTDNKEAKMIKNKQLEAKRELMGSERNKTIKELQEQFREIIIDEDILFNTFNEAKILISYLREAEVKPFLTFSGSKGFHINVFIEPLQFRNSNRVNMEYSKAIKRELRLETLDLNVTDISSRVQRVPYSKHERTGLYSVPLSPDISYDEFLEKISRKEPEVIDFNINDYYSSRSFRNMLVTLDNDLPLLDLKNKNTKKELDEKNKRHIFNNNFNSSYNRNMLDEYFPDLRELVKLILGNPDKEVPDKEYNLYKCCFHKDNNPSAICGVNVFYCFSCGVRYNHYDFIKNYYGLDSATEVYGKAEELKRKLE